ncbi:discoidin/SUN/FTP domain-containing protein [Neobacillus dielmonensis]|uniref:hypothetical protein n=1 Tax=Neobacillus dielmonensis TaxID=1347369 RepID=UPI0005A8ECB7|nr:hypothetical protein [Neobacillus dielmonensis]
MIRLSILDKDGNIKNGKNDYEEYVLPMTKESNDYCYLSTQDLTFVEGDVIRVETDVKDAYLVVKLDETLDSTILFVPNCSFDYMIEMNETALEARSDLAFKGKRHYLQARFAKEEEIASYRNWALNPHDQKEYRGAYPHASANVETRNDATFFACNAIDGVYANNSHGSYPYQSWGINRREDAALTIDFGREVEIDQVGFTLRNDFPHDSYWTEVTVEFSDGSSETFSIEKIPTPQFFSIEKRKVSTAVLCNLKKAEDDSPFPALTQIELYGKNTQF